MWLKSFFGKILGVEELTILHEFKLGNEQINNKIRVWINEYPYVNDDNKKFEIENQIITKKEKLHTNIKVACEVSLPKNAGNYALLGCTYNMLDCNFANIKVQYSKGYNKIYVTALDSEYCNKYIRMEEEYIEGVFYGVNTFNDKNTIAKGEYLFDIQAICEVGSSISLFSKITKVLFRYNTFKKYKWTINIKNYK